ncbi:MAG: hypothetical protein JWQ18_3637 [Conexibacter sp.]|nr:hypothetical protein [Conexibacter sp.]
MSDVVAEVLDDDQDGEAQEATGRPGFVRVFFFVFVGAWLGAFFGTIALAAPSFLGVASADAVGEHTVPFALDSSGAALADVAVALAMLWAVTLTVRYWLSTFVGGTPSWTWTGLTLLIAGLAAVFTMLTAGGAAALAAVAVRWTVYRADGTTRPEPFAFGLSRQRALAAGILVPVLAIGFATAYAVYHPLSDNSDGAPRVLRPGKSALYVVGPPIYNGGGRAVEVLGIEPGVEHGYALHLEDVGLLPDVGDVNHRTPFAPFVLQPKDATYSSIVLRLSRYGCRPGATGRIDSLRVRYRLGGVRTALVRLKQPLTISC